MYKFWCIFSFLIFRVVLPFIGNETAETKWCPFEEIAIEEQRLPQIPKSLWQLFWKGVIIQQVQAFQEISEMNLYFQKIGIKDQPFLKTKKINPHRWINN
jgi:hypothetical protein